MINIIFPIYKDKIPMEVERIRNRVKALDAEKEVLKKLLEMVYTFCDHAGRESGYNERDGSWNNPCPTCGSTS